MAAAPRRNGEDPKRRDVTAFSQGWPRLTGSNRSMGDNSPGGLHRRSLFDCSVQLRSDENDHDRKPDPSHETDGGAQGAIYSIVTVEFRDIPSEDHRHGDQQDGGKRAAGPQLCALYVQTADIHGTFAPPRWC